MVNRFYCKQCELMGRNPHHFRAIVYIGIGDKLDYFCERCNRHVVVDRDLALSEGAVDARRTIETS